MENYSIEITAGFGTLKEIADSLRELADAIHHPNSNGDGKNIDPRQLEGTEFGKAGLFVNLTQA